MSEKITGIIDAVKELTVLELNELVKAIEEEFGVSAAAPVAVAAAVLPYCKNSGHPLRSRHLPPYRSP